MPYTKIPYTNHGFSVTEFRYTTCIFNMLFDWGVYSLKIE